MTHILSIGLSHATSSIGLLERVIFGDEQIQAAFSSLNSGGWPGQLSEMVILSTCNRLEIYAVSRQTSFVELETFLSEMRLIEREEFCPHLYRHVDGEAAAHLFHIAAGLDSLVIGEPQILGQVTRALELAREQGTAGPVLNRLFQDAIHAGKRAHAETHISRNPASISSLAANLSECAHPNLRKAEIVVVGAGVMAELAVESLRKRGAEKIIVVNRTLERARALAGRWDAAATTFEHLTGALSSADIVITSTGAPHLIITTEMIKLAMQARPQRELVLIDIAVPRDIDFGAALIPHVRLYDLDNMNAKLEHSLAERMAEVPRVKGILREELTKFEDYLGSLEVLPVIAEMRRKAEAIRQAELEKTLRHLPDLSEAQLHRIEAMTQALVKKLLEMPTQRLRAEATLPTASAYAELARALFGLEEKDPVELPEAVSMEPAVAD